MIPFCRIIRERKGKALICFIPAIVFQLFTLHVVRSDQDELIIVSPHWEGIQYEFDWSFSQHYKELTGRSVKIRWRNIGGTSQIEKALNAEFKNTGGRTAGIDVFFGGGMDPFESQRRLGQLEPHTPPTEIINPIPQEVAGAVLYDSEMHFFAAAMSSFGILENKRVVQTLGLPPVATWADLAKPELYSWISSADPRKSGSVHMIYEIILQAYAWEKAWEIIYPFSGNVRAFLQNSSAPTKEVSVGDVAYAVSIDINGLTQQAFIGPENLRFFIPEGVSVINGDGIAILKGAPNIQVAREFVNFVLSEKGQKLWMVPRGQPGGPRKFDISRMSIIPALYDTDLSKLMVPINPFKLKQQIEFNDSLSAKRWSVINALIGNTIIDVHSHLRGAWKEIILLPDALRSELIREFSAPFATEQEILQMAEWWRTDKVRAGRQSNIWMATAIERFTQLRNKAKKLRAVAKHNKNDLVREIQ